MQGMQMKEAVGGEVGAEECGREQERLKEDHSGLCCIK